MAAASLNEAKHFEKLYMHARYNENSNYLEVFSFKAMPGL